MIGVTLGNYRIVEKIGEGGMGVVYAAEHPLIGRKAAIKVLLPELSHNAEVVTRFFNEARSTAMLKHPGLVDVFDFGHHTDGSAYIVMEFLEGESLARRIERDGRLSERLIIALGRQVAVALSAAHAKGIVHRDLKPDNVFLVPDGELACGLRAKILDFGIAKLTGDTSASSLKTRTGAVIGTPLYMSPEQCRGAGVVDRRSDIYSVGCMLYEMGCGQAPFVREGLGEVIAAHIYETVPAPRSIEPALSTGLEEILKRALAKRPEDRQQSAEQLRDELDLLSSGVPRTFSSTLSDAAAQIGSSPEGESGRPRRSFALPAALGAVVIAGVAGLALLSARGKHDPQPMNTAATRPAIAPVDAPPPVAPARVAPPAPPSLIRLTVGSEPSGAEVFRAVDGVKVGVTPLTSEVAPATGNAVFVLKLAGWKDARLELAADRPGQATVKLTRAHHAAPPPPPPPSEKPPTGTAPRRMRDGMADPFK